MLLTEEQLGPQRLRVKPKTNQEKLVPVTFQPISGDITQISSKIVKDLSTDQCLGV